MTSNEQVNANQRNSMRSTGPANTEFTRLNATKNGLNSSISKDKSKSADTIFNQLYADSKWTPNNDIQRFMLEQISILMWRLKNSRKIESKELKNSLIKSRNHRKKMDDSVLNYMDGGIGEMQDSGEEITASIDLIMRYELTNENRLLKLLNSYHSFK